MVFHIATAVLNTMYLQILRLLATATVLPFYRLLYETLNFIHQEVVAIENTHKRKHT